MQQSTLSLSDVDLINLDLVKMLESSRYNNYINIGDIAFKLGKDYGYNFGFEDGVNNNEFNLICEVDIVNKLKHIEFYPPVNRDIISTLKITSDVTRIEPNLLSAIKNTKDGTVVIGSDLYDNMQLLRYDSSQKLGINNLRAPKIYTKDKNKPEQLKFKMIELLYDIPPLKKELTFSELVMYFKLCFRKGYELAYSESYKKAFERGYQLLKKMEDSKELSHNIYSNYRVTPEAAGRFVSDTNPYMFQMQRVRNPTELENEQAYKIANLERFKTDYEANERTALVSKRSQLESKTQLERMSASTSTINITNAMLDAEKKYNEIKVNVFKFLNSKNEYNVSIIDIFRVKYNLSPFIDFLEKVLKLPSIVLIYDILRKCYDEYLTNMKKNYSVKIGSESDRFDTMSKEAARYYGENIVSFFVMTPGFFANISNTYKSTINSSLQKKIEDLKLYEGIVISYPVLEYFRNIFGKYYTAYADLNSANNSQEEKYLTSARVECESVIRALKEVYGEIRLKYANTRNNFGKSAKNLNNKCTFGKSKTKKYLYAPAYVKKKSKTIKK